MITSKPLHKQVSILGSTTHFWIYNPTKKPTIVMIHGFRGTHHGLQKIIDGLPDVRIIIPDLPGFGESSPMDQPATIRAYSQFVSQFIGQLKLGQPILLGHSFGSIVVADFVAHHPKAISKLILTNPIADNPVEGSRKLATVAIRAYYWLGLHLPARLGLGLLRNRWIVLGSSKVMTKTTDQQLRAAIHAAHLQYFSSFADRRLLYDVFQASISSNVT
ncbi:MAG TPA: alpha/beta hydrolase, partial [Candidatus Saccharimonadales bacterium]|nr:alpha/beta hydrolase [Candidatus Saccharimonadales bacterium]